VQPQSGHVASGSGSGVSIFEFFTGEGKCISDMNRAIDGY
jgi:hypothetical protein